MSFCFTSQKVMLLIVFCVFFFFFSKVRATRVNELNDDDADGGCFRGVLCIRVCFNFDVGPNYSGYVATDLLGH